jgi:hypothetical protein
MSDHPESKTICTGIVRRHRFDTGTPRERDGHILDTCDGLPWELVLQLGQASPHAFTQSFRILEDLAQSFRILEDLVGKQVTVSGFPIDSAATILIDNLSDIEVHAGPFPRPRTPGGRSPH